MARAPLLALVLVALLVLPIVPAQTDGSTGGERGTLVRFAATRFNDTVFASFEPVVRVAFEQDGDLWYATPAGIVHVDPAAKVRHLVTRADGLPSSYSLAVATRGAEVYAGTDLGFAVLNASTRAVEKVYHTWDSDLPDSILREVVVDGDDVWIGTQFGGVVVWNATTREFGEAKNTSTFEKVLPKPVRRIVALPERVWVGTDGNGAWRFDRATSTWTNLNRSNAGLPSDTVLGIAELDGAVWLGTDKGILRRDLATGQTRLFNRTSGMPDDRVWDIDVVPTVDGTPNLFAATRQGLWQYDPPTGNSETRAQDFGILGETILDDTWTAEHGWVFATTRGVSLLRDGSWNWYTTGSSNGPSAGPISATFTSASIGDSAPFLWFGSDAGVSALLPARGDELAVWYNFGEFQEYPGGKVNSIDVSGNTTWIATDTGVVGYDVDANAWRDMRVSGSRNFVYGIDAEQGELWVGLFGEGVIMRNLTTGVERSWTIATLPQAIPDPYVTDVRVGGDDVWVGSSIGVTRINRFAGTVTATYTKGDGLPDDGIVFRVVPDGNFVWLGLKTGGVAQLDIAKGQVVRAWNATNVPGFPTDATQEVRSLHREGGRLWAGTKAGLLRVDLTTGSTRVFNQSNSGLVQEFVNGISSQDGILYLATASGVARLDIEKETFLPMMDAPGEQVTGAQSGPRASPVSIRIESPRDSVGVAGVVDFRGTASRFGGRIDRVEVRVGAGEWMTADGGEFWSYAWDSSTAPQGEPIALAARAISGNDTSRVAEVLVTPVALPTVPLRVEHQAVDSAIAGRPLSLGARITGDEPLQASLYYKAPGSPGYQRIPMQRSAALFTASIPAPAMREGTLTYYIEARGGESGLLSQTSPEDPASPHVVAIGPAPSLTVSVTGPSGLVARAGASTPVTLTVTNEGTLAGTFVVSASGIRASWATVPGDPLPLEPGESKELTATLAVPLLAFADNTTLTFEARDVDGTAAPARTSIPVEVLASDASATTATTAPSRTPGPGLALVAAAAGIALFLRRRST